MSVPESKASSSEEPRWNTDREATPLHVRCSGRDAMPPATSSHLPILFPLPVTFFFLPLSQRQKREGDRARVRLWLLFSKSFPFFLMEILVFNGLISSLCVSFICCFTRLRQISLARSSIRLIAEPVRPSSPPPSLADFMCDLLFLNRKSREFVWFLVFFCVV